MPQPLRNCSHQAKPKKAASGAHPKKQSPSRFCVQAIAGVQPQKSRNVAFGTPKNKTMKNNENVLLLEPLKTMKSCRSHCETAATRQSPRKLRRERIRKSRAPAGFASKPLQEYSLKNLETLLLEPLKTMKNNENVLLLEPLKTMKSCPSHCETAATKQSPRKLRRERIRKSRAPAGFASKPLQEYSLKNLETLLLEPLKTMKNNENVLLLEPLKTMKSCPSHCETAATKQSPRKLRRERIRKSRAPAGFASKPLQEYSLKNLETLLLEPLKTMKNNENVLLLDPLKTMKSCPSHCEVAFGTPKTMKSCPSHCETAATKQSPRKLRRERIRKSRAPASFASKPLQEYSLKNLETLLLEPLKTIKNNENVLLLDPLKTMKSRPSHCETAATRQSTRKLRRERIRKSRAPAGFASKPPGKAQESCVGSASEKAEPQQVLRPSHCRSTASKISKRCFWNL